MNETIIVESRDRVAKLSFNRPNAMNSLNKEMADELAKAVEQVTQDDDIDVIVLSGIGNQFMAGGDVVFFYNNLPTMSTDAADLIDTVHKIIESLYRTDKIIVASVHGAVAGIGMSFLLTADLAIAADGTKFTLAYTKIGTSPDGGATYGLTRALGKKKALELVLFSDLFDAQEAHRLGLINWIVSSDQLQHETQVIVTRLLQGPVLAYKSCKELIRDAATNNLQEQLYAEKQAFIKATKTADFKEGVTSFVKKTKPKFTGA